MGFPTANIPLKRCVSYCFRECIFVGEALDINGTAPVPIDGVILIFGFNG
ncbi:hypothetical protein O9929_02950 [Vibrio lentus]|nr:hypothetical protein [Vibrio lentus]